MQITAMAITIRDLAEKLDLSKSTVSYALNGGPKPVSASVRLKVEQAAAEMGYRRNAIARSLAVGRTHTIGFVPSSVRLRTLQSWFERTALEAICVAADEMGLHLLLPSLAATKGGGDPDFATRVDGVVLLAPLETSELAARLHARGIPMAVIAGSGSVPGPSYDADNVGGAASVVDHLYELGHRKIALVTHPSHADVLVRQKAFNDRFAFLGLNLPPAYIETTDLMIGGGYAAARKLLALRDRPTAVICVNDPTAAGFIFGARDLGHRVPEDLSVIGFDDDEIGSTFSPSITTVRQPIAEMAVAAFESVLDQIAGRDTESRTFATRLIVRASTRPLMDTHCND
jgi:LacI family transcriptional regulator